MADLVSVPQVFAQVEYDIAAIDRAAQAFTQVEYDIAAIDRAAQAFTQVEYDIAAIDRAAQAFVQVEYFSETDLPAAPTGLAIVAGWSKNTVSWNPVTGAISYNIYWSNTR